MDNKPEIYQEERPWGNFRKFTDNTLSTVKIITINPNQELSLQSHQKRAELWHVTSGSGVFEIDGKSYAVESGDENFVPTGVKHRIKAGEYGLGVLEISLGDFIEEDIVRYEDNYGRA